MKPKRHFKVESVVGINRSSLISWKRWDYCISTTDMRVRQINLRTWDEALAVSGFSSGYMKEQPFPCLRRLKGSEGRLWETFYFLPCAALHLSEWQEETQRDWTKQCEINLKFMARMERFGSRDIKLRQSWLLFYPITKRWMGKLSRGNKNFFWKPVQADLPTFGVMGPGYFWSGVGKNSTDTTHLRKTEKTNQRFYLMYL